MREIEVLKKNNVVVMDRKYQISNIKYQISNIKYQISLVLSLNDWENALNNQIRGEASKASPQIISKYKNNLNNYNNKIKQINNIISKMGTHPGSAFCI